MLQKTTNKQCKTFKRFVRKNYSVFSSLHSEIRIGVLSVATLVSATTTDAPAQTRNVAKSDTLTSLSLDETTVTGTRTPIAAEKAARVVSVITRDEIARAGAASVNDLLKLTAGADVRQRGGFGVQTDISINGGTFDEISILLNGVNVNNPQTGHLSADFPVSPDDIERIEILEGAAGRLFGSQAFGGAINIVTRRPKADAVQATAAAGSFGTVESGASIGFANAAASHFASGNYRRSDGGTANSDFKQGRAFYNGRYKTDGAKIDWQGGYSAQSYGANTFYSAAYPDQWEENSRILLSARAETEGRVHFAPQVSWLRSNDHFQLIRRSPRGENFHRSDVYTATVNAWTAWAPGRTSAGMELRHESILSTNLGRPLDSTHTVKIPGGGGRRFTHSDSRANVSCFLEHNVVLRAFTLSAGLLANRNSAVDHRFRFFPGVDVSYRPGEHTRFFASWNNAMRLPTFTDLYYKSPTLEGNVGLRPEKTTSLKVGADYRNDALHVLAQGYYNRGRDMIDWVMRSPDDVYHSSNFALDNVGGSLSVEVDFTRLPHRPRFLRRASATYAYIHQRRKDRQIVYRSNYALEYLRHKAVLTLEHGIAPRLTAAWTFRWQQREGAYIKYAGAANTGRLVKYRPYGLLNVKMRWTADNYELYLAADNLTAHRYYDLGNIPQPRCWFTAGAKLTIPL